MAITGPAKSGKSYTSMRLMNHLCGPGNWCVIDTENGSAEKYADVFDFSVMELKNHHPSKYIEAIYAAHKAGFKGVVIDSLSHEWMGKGGCLQLVDQLSDGNKSSFNQWGTVTPLHNEVFDVINRSPMHMICTLRVKTEYVMEEYEQHGKKKSKPVKVGLAPVTRDGADYEFDILMDMNKGHGYIDHMSRCPYVKQLAVQHPGEQVAQLILDWLNGEKPSIDLPETPSTEEKMFKVTSAPAPDKGELSGPRPSVPTEAPKEKPAPKPSTSFKSKEEMEAAKQMKATQDAAALAAKAKPAEQAPPPKQEDPATSADHSPTPATSAPSSENAPALPQVDEVMLKQLCDAGKDNGWQLPQIVTALKEKWKCAPLQMTQKQWATTLDHVMANAPATPLK